MPFRAQARFDFGEKDPNEYQKMIAAFMQAGWSYVETSSVAVETNDLVIILQGLDICARQIPFAGKITGLSFDVQWSDNFSGVPYAAAANHPYALQDVQARPSP